MKRVLSAVLLSLTLLVPAVALGHEVYVLPEEAIQAGMLAESPNPFSAIQGNELQFLFWGFVAFVIVSTIFFATIFHVFERSTAPFFNYIKRFAHPLVRIGVAACLLSFGYHGAIFGPEFPLSELFGAYEPIAKSFLGLAGILVLVGMFVRPVALALLALWGFVALTHGIHALGYTNYLGAFALLFILGGGMLSIDHHLRFGAAHMFSHIGKSLTPYALPFLRITFGFGVVFAAIYAKYLHSALALDVVIRYNLTDYFKFDPLFVVLGALIVETIAGLMILFGVAIRWTGLFLLFWLTLSQFYFQEAVWPHLILFFLGLALFCHGYDKYSLEGKFFRKNNREPVL